MPHPIFLGKGKMSDCYFLHIDRALKTRPCRPFVLRYSRADVLFLNSSIIEDITLVYTSTSNFPPEPSILLRERTTVKYPWVGVLQLRIDRRINPTCTKTALCTPKSYLNFTYSFFPFCPLFSIPFNSSS